MQGYYPSQPPVDPTLMWLIAEFQKISETLSRGDQSLKIIVSSAGPDKPLECELRVADGVNWNPGSGPGTYIYRNGEWRLIEAGANNRGRSLAYFLGE